MRTWLAAVALLELGGAACTFDDTVPPGAVIACTDDDGCVDGLVCVDFRCVAAGSAPPILTSLTLDPAEASDGDLVALRIETNVPLATAPLLAFLAEDPGFAVSRFEEGATTAEYALEVAGGVAEGYHVLSSVALSSVAGLDAVALVDSTKGTLHVDRTPPRVDVALRKTGTRADAALLPLSDVEGTNELDVTISASEPILDVTAGLDGADAELDCALDDASPAAAICTLVATAGPAVDSVDVVVTVRDAAGNETLATAAIDVDFVPPSVVFADVSVSGALGTVETTATPGASVLVDVVMDEPLGAPAVATLNAPVTTSPLSVVAGGNALAFTVAFDVLDVGVDALSAPLALGVVDEVGHAAVVDGAVIAFGRTRLGPCSPYEVGGAAPPCFDVDGDGRFAAVPTCPQGTDCDDGDPLVFGGAPELPGDGVDNACSGAGDLPIDDTTGAFVSSSGSDAAGCGAQASPCATLGRALQQQPGAAHIYMSAGDFSFAQEIDVPLVGSLDPVTWQRPPPSPTNAPPPTTVMIQFSSAYDAPFLDGVRIDTLFSSLDDVPVVVARAAMRQADLTGSALFVDSAVLENVNTRDDTRIVECDIDELDVLERATTIVRSRIEQGGVFIAEGASFEAVSSLLARAAFCAGCLRVALYQSTMVSIDDDILLPMDAPDGLTTTNAVLDVFNSVLHVATVGGNGAGGILVSAPGVRWRIAGSQLSSVRANAILFGSAGFTIGFDDAAGFESFDPGFPAEDDVHDNVILPIPADPGVGGGGNILQTGPVSVGAPIPTPNGVSDVSTSVFRDLFGHCRTEGGLAGADASFADDVW